LQEAASLQASTKQLIAQNKAALANARETRAAARSHEQFVRGAQATSLSFLGIRGATLAASRSFLIAAAATAVFFKALGEASRFTNELNVFQATTSATADQMERVREAARALGADITLPAVTSADAAEAMTELAKAGLSVQDSIDGARGVLQLATAAAINNAQAVELAANALNAFGLQGRDTTRVADVFANAANAAQGSIAEIGTAFQQAAAAGRQVGLSFEDTATFLTILARNGLRGSDAGTSLRTALLRLIRPTDQAAEKLRKLGIEVRDAQGNLRPDVFQQITNATRDMTPAMRDATIALIGGQDAFRAISILGRQPIGTLIALRRELREQGTAAKLAEARTRGLSGAADALSSTLETVGVRAGRAVTPGIQSMIESITASIQGISESEQAARAFSGALDFVTISARATVTALGPLVGLAAQTASGLAAVANAVGVPTILAAVAAYKLLPSAIAKATDALTAFNKTASLAAVVSLVSKLNPVGVAAAVTAGAIFLLATRESAAERATRKLRESLDELKESLGGVADAQSRLSSARQGVRSAATTVDQARAAQAQARAALEASKAPPGSREFIKLQNALKIATQDVTFALEEQGRALDELDLAQEEFNFSQKRLADAQTAAVQGVLDRITQVQQEVRRAAAGAPRGGLGVSAAEAEAKAREKVIDTLRRESQVMRQSDDQQRRLLGARIGLIAELGSRLQALPDEQQIDLIVRTEDLDQVLRKLAPQFGVEGKRATAIFARVVQQELKRGLNVENAVRVALDVLPAIASDVGKRMSDALERSFVEGIAAATPRIGASAAAALRQLLKRLSGRLAGLEREETTLRIQGAGPEAFLENLRRREEILRRRIAALKLGRPSRERAREQLADVLEEQRRIQEQMADDAREAADKARREQEERDKNLLEALGLGREAIQERIRDAQLTEGLRDDIRRNRELRQLVQRQIEIIRDRIKTAEIRVDAIRELRSITRELAREIRRLQEERRAEIQERIAESIQLDIEFAQITGRRNLEIAAHQREIRRLQRLIAETKKGTVEYKRLRNQIAEQRRAIRELRKEEDEHNRAFRELVFAQLQRQQGFATRLLGNLIPLGASGLVGPSPPQPAEGAGRQVASTLERQTALAQAQGAAPTRGQATVEIDILRQILHVLREIQRGRAHPEAREQRARAGAAMDVM
jgi:TP901 family phage tail tape measure protein